MDEKFSVIIPTMWYSDRIHNLIKSLNECDEVGEIVIIDNNTMLKPDYLDSIHKLTYLPQIENIFVNPSWNMGVLKSKYENLCISNDDIEYDMDVFEYLKPHIKKGVIGLATENYSINNSINNYEVIPISERNWGWGCLFFIHKSNWISIDERLKIACGDDFLIKFVKGGAYQIKNLQIRNERVSITSLRSEFLEQQQNDIKLWSQF